MNAYLRRLSGFTLSTIFSAVVSVLVLPIVIPNVEIGLWGGYVTAQSFGAIGAIFVGLGWTITGPAKISELSASRKILYFRESIKIRFFAFLIVSPLVAFAVIAWSPGNKLANVFGSFAMILPMLGANWFFVGNRDPKQLFFVDTVPRILGSLVGACLVMVTKNIIYLGIFQVSGVLIAVILGIYKVSKQFPYDERHRNRPVAEIVSDQIIPTTIGAFSTIYGNLPMIIVSVFANNFLDVFAMATKILGMFVMAFTPYLQFSQGYVTEEGNQSLISRSLKVTKISVGIGFLGFLLIAIGGSLFSSILSRGEILIGYELSLPFGAIFFFIAISATIGLACLPALNKIKVILWSTITGLAIGLPLFVLLGIGHGYLGIAWGSVLAESTVTLFQIVSLSHFRRKEIKGYGPI